MKHAVRLLNLAKAFNQVLPSDKYASLDEWVQRQNERLKDLGFAPDQMQHLVNETRDASALRYKARTSLVDIVARKCRLTRADPTLKESARQFVLHHLQATQQFVGLHPERNLVRYAKHIRYWSRRSERIKTAYAALFKLLRTTSNAGITADHESDDTTVRFDIVTYVNAIRARAPVEHLDGFARQFGYRYWGANSSGPYQFIATGQFIACAFTGAEVPSMQSVSVVFNDDGRTKRAHPAFAMSDKVRRDAITGAYVLVDAVEWVELADSDELAWRRPNEASGRVYRDEDDGLWYRTETNGRLAGYHSAPRQWRSSDAGNYTDHIGVELECGFSSSANLSRFLSRHVDTTGRFVGGRPFLIESDGSLESVPNGVEIVSEPLPLHEGYQAEDSHWRWLLDKLVRGGGEGWKHRQYAGIHVNMDVSNRSPNAILRYVVFVHNAAAISKFVSGRKVIYGADSDESNSRRVPSDKELSAFDNYLKANKQHYGGGYEKIGPEQFRRITGTDVFSRDALAQFRRRGKYQPVNIRSGMPVLETRIFGSNIRYQGFMACVEFCVAGMEFTSELPNDLDVLHPEIGVQFRAWLSDNASKYPNLVARIGAPAGKTAHAVTARPLAELTA